jgi:hypothetical protein
VFCTVGYKNNGHIFARHGRRQAVTNSPYRANDLTGKRVYGYWYYCMANEKHYILSGLLRIRFITSPTEIDPTTLAWNTGVEEPYERGEKGKQLIWASFEYEKGVWPNGGSIVSFSFQCGVYHTDFSDELTITEQVKYINGRLMVGKYSLEKAIEEGLEIIGPACDEEEKT